MVFFTCNNCGDSLKKKDCANHAGKCRPLALTCVDCHKDFFGDEFVAHTSCVTEAEKYGVKGFVSRAPSTAGVAKQEEWTRAVLSASEATGLTSSQKYFLGILTRHGNVPRKKKPFQNFARNVWRDSVRNISVVDQVFDLLEAELKKIKGPPKESDTSKTTAEIIGKINDEAVNNSAELKVDIATNKKPKGKKEKALDELVAIANGGREKTDIDVIKDERKKSKKNKEEPFDNVKESKENENETEEAPTNTENDTVSKKSKKKKRKNRDAEIEEEAAKYGNGIVVESVAAEDDQSNTKKKKKKRKQKEAQAEEEAKNENGLEVESVNAEDDFSSAGKKKKKKNKVEINENGSVELLVEDLPKKAKKKHKKQKENGIEALENSNGQEESQFDAAKDTIKKSKKKKHKLQEVEEDVPRKKSKSTSG